MPERDAGQAAQCQGTSHRLERTRPSVGAGAAGGWAGNDSKRSHLGSSERVCYKQQMGKFFARTHSNASVWATA